MPGLVALVGGDPSDELVGKCERVAARRGCGFRRIEESGYLLMGVASCSETEYTVARSDSWLTVVYGTPLKKRGGRWFVVEASDVLNDVECGRDGWFLDLDGFFQIALLELGSRKVSIITSPTGAPPLFAGEKDGAHCWAADGATILSLLGIPPSLDEVACFQFLNIGHTVGARPLFAGVRRVGPAMVETAATDGAGFTAKRYWDFRCQSREWLGGAEARGALWSAIREASKAVLVCEAPSISIALTGGYDSRVVLAALPDKDLRPRTAFTWGERWGIPRSDPVVAREVAGYFGLKHVFVECGPESLRENLRAWLELNEGLNDNMGFLAAGRGALDGVLEPGSTVLIGDHVIGLGGLPPSIDAAVEAVLRIPPRSGEGLVRAVSGFGEYAQLEEALWLEVENVVKRCPSRVPKDVQDYLFFHIHWPGWLSSPGFHREPVRRVFRPLMMKPVLELLGRFPQDLRVDKRILIDVIRGFLGDVGKIPVATARSTVDWEYHCLADGPVRQFVEGYSRPEVVEVTRLGRLLDLDAFSALRGAFFSRTPIQENNGGSSALLGARRIRRVLAGFGVAPAILSLGERFVRGMLPAKHFRQGGLKTYKLLERVALVSYLELEVLPGLIPNRGSH